MFPYFFLKKFSEKRQQNCSYITNDTINWCFPWYIDLDVISTAYERQQGSFQPTFTCKTMQNDALSYKKVHVLSSSYPCKVNLSIKNPIIHTHFTSDSGGMEKTFSAFMTTLYCHIFLAIFCPENVLPKCGTKAIFNMNSNVAENTYSRYYHVS